MNKKDWRCTMCDVLNDWWRTRCGLCHRRR